MTLEVTKSEVLVDPTGNTISGSGFMYPAISAYGLIDIVSDLGPTLILYDKSLEAALERVAFASLAEASFAEDWDSPEDAVYDNL